MKNLSKGVAMLFTCAMVFNGASVYVNAEGAKALEDEKKTVTVDTSLTREEFVDTVESWLKTPDFATFAEKSNTANLGNYHWCASFISFCLGKDVTGKNNPYRLVSSIENAFKNAGRYHDVNSDYVPMVGDLVLYDENGNPDDGCEHIGVVNEADENGIISIVEGNSYKWVPHCDFEDVSDFMKNDCHKPYEISFTEPEFNEFGDVEGIGDFTEKTVEVPVASQSDSGEDEVVTKKVYTVIANACWDYYYDSNRVSHSPEKRSVVEFKGSEIKQLFISGYCSPKFKNCKKKTKKNSTVSSKVNDVKVSLYDVNGDNEVSIADFVAFVNYFKDNDFANGEEIVNFKNKKYDVTGDGIISKADFRQLYNVITRRYI